MLQIGRYPLHGIAAFLSSSLKVSPIMYDLIDSIRESISYHAWSIADRFGEAFLTVLAIAILGTALYLALPSRTM
jgi:hypothetical protein